MKYDRSHTDEAEDNKCELSSDKYNFLASAVTSCIP